MFLQSAAMVALKLLVDDKITACFKQKGVICKISNTRRKTLSGETFRCLEKRLFWI